MVHDPPGPVSGTHMPFSQCAEISQPASFMHVDAHTGGVCAVPGPQICGGYGPHALASMPEQPESSSTVVVPHWNVGLHAPSILVPWHVPGVLHTAAWS